MQELANGQNCVLKLARGFLVPTEGRWQPREGGWHATDGQGDATHGRWQPPKAGGCPPMAGGRPRKARQLPPKSGGMPRKAGGLPPRLGALAKSRRATTQSGGTAYLKRANSFQPLLPISPSGKMKVAKEKMSKKLYSTPLQPPPTTYHPCAP